MDKVETIEAVMSETIEKVQQDRRDLGIRLLAAKQELAALQAKHERLVSAATNVLLDHFDHDRRDLKSRASHWMILDDELGNPTDS